MRLFELVFSPTGGTKKIADILCSDWDCPVSVIDLSDPNFSPEPNQFTDQDICLVAVPSFGGRVPEIALSRLAQFQGNGAKTILTIVYGNRAYDDTILELYESLTQQDFCCVAAVAAIAEHSIMRQFAAGRPDAQDKEQLRQFALQIRSSLSKKSCLNPSSIPGNHPFREYHGVPFRPTAESGCTNCGSCVSQCPVSAIPAENPSSVDVNRCIACMRCISVCPSHVRKIDEKLLAATSQKMEAVFVQRKQNELFL